MLASIPASQRQAVVADLAHMSLDANELLSPAGQSMSSVYFPTGAVISTTYACGGAVVDVRGIGREGMLGADALRATEQSRFELVCQVGGSMLYMPMPLFRAHLKRHPALGRAISLYAAGVLTLMTQSVACNGLHSIAQRCARWLLVTSDRVGSAEFPLTQALLARMLGVHRPGVSLALKRLQRAALIRYRLGRIGIIDKAGLQMESCECYGVVVREIRRISRKRASPPGLIPRLYDFIQGSDLGTGQNGLNSPPAQGARLP